ncbi:hypothetical protein LX36DRAFT_41892 [Colletotrichum falcatum]|nr:hypothetical protein LX36DRAFT_41892 [Colletotrichum falcatum]
MNRLGQVLKSCSIPTPNRPEIELNGLAVDKGFKSAHGGGARGLSFSPSFANFVLPVSGLESMAFLAGLASISGCMSKVALPLIETPRYPQSCRTRWGGGGGRTRTAKSSISKFRTSWVPPVLDDSTTIPHPRSRCESGMVETSSLRTAEQQHIIYSSVDGERSPRQRWTAAKPAQHSTSRHSLCLHSVADWGITAVACVKQAVMGK